MRICCEKNMKNQMKNRRNNIINNNSSNDNNNNKISLIKNIASSSECENLGENLTSSKIKLLKTNTRLPIWLDDYIFKTLKAQYSPNHERFDFNLDLSESDILKYLGTYFPRSYGESFCIFDNFKDKFS